MRALLRGCLLGLAACAAPPIGGGVDLEALPDDAFRIVVAATIDEAIESAIREISSRGAVAVSSREGGWLVGDVERTEVRLHFESIDERVSAIRVSAVDPDRRAARPRVAETLAIRIARRLR